MRFDEAMGLLTPLQREIVRALLRGEEQSGDEMLARRHATSVEAVRAERFVACDRLRRALAASGHSDPYLPD
jgi:hypothetical protein